MYESCMPACTCYIIIILCMKVCLCYIIYLYVCANEDVYTLYVYMETCCMLATGSTGRCHALRHTFCNLFTLQLTCEKDVGMGLCTFNFVLRHIVCLLFGTSSLHLFLIFSNFFLLTLCDFFGCHA